MQSGRSRVLVHYRECPEDEKIERSIDGNVLFYMNQHLQSLTPSRGFSPFATTKQSSTSGSFQPTISMMNPSHPHVGNYDGARDFNESIDHVRDISFVPLFTPTDDPCIPIFL